MVRQLVAANMTAAEVTALAKGDKGALAKFNDFVEFAVEESMKTYFRGNSDFQKKLMRLFDGHPVVQIIFGTLIPFPRMLINSMRTVLQYSPAGFLMAAHTHLNDQSAFATIRRNKQLGQAFTGTVLIALGTILGAIGWLGFDKDDEFGGVKLRIGDLRLALDDLQPSTIPLIVGASMTDPNTEGLWNKLTLGGRTLLNATVLGEMIEIFGGNKKSEDVVVDTFESFVNQFMPSAFRHIARTIDPTQKKYSSNGFVKTFQRILASFPGTSFIVPTKIDPYTGEAIYQNVKNDRGWASVFSFFNAFSPAKISLASVSDVQAESEYVGAPTTGPSSVYKIDGVEYKIPDKLYREYQVLRARLYAQYTKDIINTSAYKNLTIEKKKLRLERLQEQATREARKQLNIGK